MVGSPYQRAEHLAKDLKFIEEFSPHMCGIGPFISHKDTPFKDEKSGEVISGVSYFVVTVDENGEIYECKVKPFRASDKALLNMLVR